MVESINDSPTVAQIVATSRIPNTQQQLRLGASGVRPGLRQCADGRVNIPLLSKGQWAKDCLEFAETLQERKEVRRGGKPKQCILCSAS